MTEQLSQELNVLPVLGLRGQCPMPGVEMQINVGRDKSVNAIITSEKEYQKRIILVMQKNHEPEITADSLFDYGVMGTVVYRIKQINDTYKIKVKLTDKVKIYHLAETNSFLVASYEVVNETIPQEEDFKFLRKLITKEISKNPAADASDFMSVSETDFKKDAITYINRLVFNAKFATEKEKYDYLSKNAIYDKVETVVLLLRKGVMYDELENKINQAVDEALQQSQKEYYLREKIRVIQDELGDRNTKEKDATKFRDLINKSGMPEETKAHLLEEVNRFLSASSMSADANVSRNYLEFATSLPWSKVSTDCDNIKKVEKTLDENHYGLKKVKERILEYLSVQIKTQKNPQTIICFVGPPGVGKTSLAFSIAKALNRKFVKQSLGGIRDEAEVRGHRRTYVGAMPGRILKGMTLAQTVNPVFLLDEIDKMGQSYMGDPASAMLEVLDPEQNFRFSDNYLEEPYDLSKVMFITTANYLDDIPEPLRDRMEIIFLSSYTEHEKLHICKNHLIPRVLEKHGLAETEFQMPDEAIYYLIRYYTREAGVRELERLVSSLVRKVIKEQLEKKTVKSVVDSKQIAKYLGSEKFSHNIVEKKSQVGIVTGLAYTQYGGDTLEVEATCFPGKGQLNITGKLGDVMKESVATAFSHIKTIAEQQKIDHTIFQNNDFHIHVPEGAVPKDGPSAGITLATAIYSLVSKKPVNHEVGMTGEITLRGTILPIGGLKEKSIAAHRSGLKKILIPSDNKKDLNEVPEEVKKELEIVLVKNFSDVFKHVFDK